jgi:hypothetical protein
MHTHTNTHNPNRNKADIQREELAAQLANDAFKAARNKMIAPRSYTDLYKPLVIISWVCIGLAAVYSGTTEFAYFYSFGSSEALGYIVLTVLCATVAVISMELAKNYLLGLAFYKIFKEKTFAYFPVLSALLCSLVSVFCSYKGAPDVAAIATKDFVTHSPQLINLDSINQIYNAQIEKNEVSIGLVRSQNTRNTGEIRSTGQKNINDLSVQNNLLIANREKAINEAQKTNTDSLNAAVVINKNAAISHQKYAAERKENLALFAIICELVLWGLSAFCWNYNVQSWYEDGAPDLTPSPVSPTPPNNGGKNYNNSTQYNLKYNTEPTVSDKNTAHSPPPQSALNFSTENTEENHNKKVENNNVNSNFLFNNNSTSSTIVENSQIQPENTVKNDVNHSPHNTEIQTKNNTTQTVENTVKNNTVFDVFDAQNDGVVANEKPKSVLKIIHPVRETQTTQIELFDAHKKSPNTALIEQINTLKQRHQIEIIDSNAKGKVVVSYAIPDEYSANGFVRKKSTPTIKTHYNTYRLRAKEAEEKNKPDIAKSNREKANILADIITFCELIESQSKNGQQEIG